MKNINQTIKEALSKEDNQIVKNASELENFRKTFISYLGKNNIAKEQFDDNRSTWSATIKIDNKEVKIKINHNVWSRLSITDKTKSSVNIDYFNINDPERTSILVKTFMQLI